MKVIDEQIELLKSKGLKFKNIEYAKKILLRENYYNLINGYPEVFLNLKNNHFDIDTYFEELYAIYIFDNSLKYLLLDYINIIENNIKSYIAYTLTDNYGEKNFLIRNNFNDHPNTNNTFNKLKEQIEKNIDRTITNTKDRIVLNDNISPLKLIKIFTFGNVTTLYQILKNIDKKKIEEYTNINSRDLLQFLHTLQVARNICAHGDVLFNIKLSRSINFSNYYEDLYLDNFYAIMLILKLLLDNKTFNEFLIKLNNLFICVKQEIDITSYNNLINIMGLNDNIFLKKDKNIYTPSPIDTSNIILDKEILELSEKLAENAHDIWAVKRINEGWRYGTIRDDIALTTPDLIPYKELSNEEKEYDINTSIETLKVIKKLGYNIIKECD